LLARAHACHDARHAFDVAIGLAGDPAVRRYLQDRQAALPR
jgi:RNA polymerase sigma-70 factor (ECF subfamily)